MPTMPTLSSRPTENPENRYSLTVGLIFIFNIIVGTGALTLPAAFSKAGWLLGGISIAFLAFVSYINATYVIESMACANAVLRWNRTRNDHDSDAPAAPDLTNFPVQAVDETSDISSDEREERHPTNREENWLLTSAYSRYVSRYYSLDNRVELGEMATLFFNPLGRIVFYTTMVIYLFGDLSIYSAAIGKSTMDVICSYNSTNASISLDVPCFNTTDANSSFTRLECYRIILMIFITCLGPFVFFNVQKTKHLQIFTSVMRWLAFGIMITLAIRSLVKNGAEGRPPLFDMSGTPALFGACIYSFMCHHSLPGMVAPITSKRSLWSALSLDFVLITFFYLLLAITGVFAFKELQDLYTLNFVPSDNQDGMFLKILEYFLALFPVFTLSTTFPVIAITLRNNIQCIFLDMTQLHTYNLFLRRFLFPVVAIIPPILITMFFEDITMLVSFTGSFAGTGVQYLIPTFLVMCARKECKKIFGSNVINAYQSPFQHLIWSMFIVAWSIICVILVSLHMIKKRHIDSVFLM